MFSRRLGWPVPHNRLARLLRERRTRGRPVLDLTESNPTRAAIDYPADAITAALADPGAAAYEPDPRGLPEARAAVVSYYDRRGLEISPGRIVLTASTSEAYALLFKMLADPGDRILVPRPSYPLFEYLAALESVRVSPYPLDYDGAWRIDLGAVESAVARGDAAAGGTGPARAIVVVSPNNPTGSALRESERTALASIASGAGVAIISDEVFCDYLYADRDHGAANLPSRDSGDRTVSMLARSRRGEGPPALVFTLGGLSKACGMPQMKLGWVVVGGPEELAAEALDRLELIADTYLSVGTPVQRAAARLIRIGEGIQEEIRRRVLGNRETLGALIGSASPCRMLEADGGWSAVLQVPSVLPEEDFVIALLEKDDTLVHPGYFFDFPSEAYLVLSLLPEPGIFHEGARRVLARASGG